MKGKLVFLAVFILIGTVLAEAANAQGVKIGISPVVFELTANPGDVIGNEIKVFNSSDDATVRIEMSAEDMSPSDEEGHVLIGKAEKESYSLSQWVTFSEEEFSLAPREEKNVSFVITVPQNAEPGGKYCSVLAGSKVISGMEATGAAIAARVGALVLLSLPGEEQKELSVKEFSVSKKYFEYGPIDFLIRLENKGTVHVKPTGNITVTDWLGNKVADISFDSRNVLPGAVRKFEATLDKKWLFAGKYTATLTGSYGGTNIPLTPTVIAFWAFPWKFGAGIMALIIFFVLTRKRWLAAFKILLKGER